MQARHNAAALVLICLSLALIASGLVGLLA